MNRSQLKAHRCYRLEGTDTYFLSPDGIGVYWYDGLAEFGEAHGKPDFIHTVKSLTDW